MIPGTIRHMRRTCLTVSFVIHQQVSCFVEKQPNSILETCFVFGAAQHPRKRPISQCGLAMVGRIWEDKYSSLLGHFVIFGVIWTAVEVLGGYSILGEDWIVTTEKYYSGSWCSRYSALSSGGFLTTAKSLVFQ